MVAPEASCTRNIKPHGNAILQPPYNTQHSDYAMVLHQFILTLHTAQHSNAMTPANLAIVVLHLAQKLRGCTYYACVSLWV